MKAQNCDAKIEVKIDGTACESNGVPVTISVKGSNLDLSKCYFVVFSSNGPKKLSVGQTDVVLASGFTYTIHANNLKCNGKEPEPIQFKIELKATKAEYKRCSVSDIYVSATVSGGKGPYNYQLSAGEKNIATGISEENEISFPASTLSSNLKLKITDEGCTQNNTVTVVLDNTADYGSVSSVIEGDTVVCASTPIKLSVNSKYSGSNFEWKKGNKVISTNKTMEIPKATEADTGEYTFSMKFDGCEKQFLEKFNIKVGDSPTLKVTSPVHICLNSKEVSLSDYVFATSKSYTLVWYKSDSSLIGETAPMFNPDLQEKTAKYFVSQQNAAGCKSPETELTITVDNPPAAISANSLIICLSEDSKHRVRVIHADKNTYNLYTAYKGGTKIGSGKAINDTAIIKISQDLVETDYFLETENEHGCLSNNRTTVPIKSKKSLIVGPKEICLGNKLTLSANYAGGEILWTKPGNSCSKNKILEIDSVTFNDTGTYSLLIKDLGLSCVMRDTIQVKVTQPASPYMAKNSIRYYQNEKESALKTLKATPKTGFTLKWYDPDNNPLTGQSPFPATDKIGTFVYHVSQDSLGCESPKASVTVIVGPVPSPVLASDINVCIADKPEIQIKHTVKDYKYTVYYKNKAIAERKGNDSTIYLTSEVPISENAELEITVTDIYNVDSPPTKTSLIAVNNLIDVKNSSSSVCDGSNVKLLAVNITGAAYEWKMPNGNTVNKESVTVSNASKTNAGVYALAVTTPGCPAAKQTVGVKIEKPAKPSTTKEISYCTGSSATQLTATALAGYKTVWFDELQELTSAPIPNTAVAGTSVYYVLQVSISDANCSSDKEKISVTVENKPDSMVLETVHVCYASGDAKPVSVRIPASSKGYIYSLYSMEKGGSLLGQTTSSNDNSPVDITIDDSEIQSEKVYYFEITNKAGCASNRTPLKVMLTEITVSPNKLPAYQVEEFYSQKLATNAPDPKYSIVQGYLPMGFTISSTGDISGIASSYIDPATFTVEITGNLGCSIQKEYVLKSKLLVSKMFSPNGDGINDIFMKGYRVVIFDRLGRRLSNSNDGWDGTFNGRMMPEDVYFYILYYKDEDGKEQHITSYLTLIKMI